MIGGVAIPVEISKYPELSLVVIEFSGRLTRADLMTTIANSFSEPEDAHRERAFLDLTQLVSAEIGFADILGFTLRVSEARENSRADQIRVGVAAPGNLAYGLARMYQQLMEINGSFDVMVSRDREEVLHHVQLECVPA